MNKLEGWSRYNVDDRAFDANMRRNLWLLESGNSKTFYLVTAEWKKHMEHMKGLFAKVGDALDRI